MEKNNKELLKLGDVYAFQLETGAVITGVLSGISENLIKNEAQTYYRLALNESKYIDLQEDEIVNIRIIEIPDNKGYFKEFEKKYGVKCFDSDDNLLSASAIMRNVLVHKNVWDKLSDEEKVEFVECLGLDTGDIVELIGVYMTLKKENENLHDNKIRTLDATLELMKKYDKYTGTDSYAKNIYELIFKGLGLEMFINTICMR